MRDINLLHPAVRQRARDLVSLCKAQGIDIIITQTLRSKAEQDALYSLGRAKAGSIVTSLKYPSSLHCWGVAFDFAVKVNGKVTYSRIDLYDKVGRVGKYRLGLVWGGDWKKLVDRPHFQLPNVSVDDLTARFKTPDRYIKAWAKK